MNLSVIKYGTCKIPYLKTNIEVKKSIVAGDWGEGVRERGREGETLVSERL